MAKIIIGAALVVGAVIGIITGQVYLSAWAISALVSIAATGASMLIGGIVAKVHGNHSPGTGIAIRQAAAPWNVVYGRARIGGTVIYATNSGFHNGWFRAVVDHCCHNIAQPLALYLDGKLVNISTAMGGVNNPAGGGGDSYDNALQYDWQGNQYNFKDYVHWEWRNGLLTALSAYADLVSYDPNWTSNCLCVGRTTSYLRLKYDATQTIFPNSVPGIRVDLKGKCDIYDPRTGTRGYTENWALIIADYLCTPKSQFGFGANYSTEIDETQLIAAANICDEQVPLAGIQYAPWAPNTGEPLTAVVEPTTPNGYCYVCTTNGTTGGSEPTWPTVIGTSVMDGSVQWTCQGLTGGSWNTTQATGVWPSGLFPGWNAFPIPGGANTNTSYDGWTMPGTAALFDSITLTSLLNDVVTPLQTSPPPAAANIAQIWVTYNPRAHPHPTFVLIEFTGPNPFISGQQVTLSGLTSDPALNGMVLTSAGPSTDPNQGLFWPPTGSNPTLTANWANETGIAYYGTLQCPPVLQLFGHASGVLAEITLTEGQSTWTAQAASGFTNQIQAGDTLGLRIKPDPNYNCVGGWGVQAVLSYVTGSVRYEPRYAVNGTFQVQGTPGDVLNNLMTAAAGRVTCVGGIWKIYPAAWYGTSIAIGDDDLAGPIKWIPKRKGRDLVNAVKGTFICPTYPYISSGPGLPLNQKQSGIFDGMWQPTDFPSYQKADYLCDDAGVYGTNDRELWAPGAAYAVNDAVICWGEPWVCTAAHVSDSTTQPGQGASWATVWQHVVVDRSWQDLRLAFTISTAAAQRIAKIYLMRNRQQGVGTLICKPMALRSQVLDVIQWTHANFGFASKLCEVTNFRFVVNTPQQEGDAPTFHVELDLQETDPSVYSWSPAEEQVLYAPNASIPLGAQ